MLLPARQPWSGVHDHRQLQLHGGRRRLGVHNDARPAAPYRRHCVQPDPARAEVGSGTVTYNLNDMPTLNAGTSPSVGGVNADLRLTSTPMLLTWERVFLQNVGFRCTPELSLGLASRVVLRRGDAPDLRYVRRVASRASLLPDRHRRRRKLSPASRWAAAVLSLCSPTGYRRRI